MSGVGNNFTVLAVISAVSYLFLGWTATFVLGLLWFICTEGRYRSVLVNIKMAPRDLSTSINFLKYAFTIKYWEWKGWTTPQVLLEHTKRHPDKPAIVHESSTFTFSQVEEYSNRVANYFKAEGIKRGDAVAIFMEARPEYVCMWLGLSKIGAVSALVNTNQRSNVLAHSLQVASCKAVIVGTELSSHIKEILSSIPDIDIYISGKDKSSVDLKGKDLDSGLQSSSTDPVPKDIALAKMTDKFAYIYTSGTTGLPKAAVMTHCRFMFMVVSTNKVVNITEDDVVYDPLPLYHTAGGLLGIGQALLCGSTVVIRSKFSASNFWTDCIKYNCTVAQYIGEMCRYLLALPEKPEEKQHKVRLIVGNGLRPQIWAQFMKRFNIERVGEFYGATEGNANLMNGYNKIGAVGYVPWFAVPVYPVTLVKADPETNEPIRGENGLCIKCKTGEPGILIGAIKKSQPSSHFSGYADKKASEKKIIRDVFKKGDEYFNSGDLLVRDEYGYYYFKDRTGDTFRWRGENVATSEVEAVISNVVGLRDAVVYGVEIPNVEGKAGMAAIVDEQKQLDIAQLENGIKNSLPSYARPLFLRVIEQVPLTATFKLKKLDLQSEGYDPSKINDPLYFMDAKSGKYVTLTPQLYQEIVEGKQRL
ncbi:hypothetical protein LSTR_LSTR008147 [Laodelphax striatellus]|uniref:long-chain-fatty-acid--CoA ligase n=1 Tax=Laodelphax striatellus TaxID=195883 RepID=A0A482WYW1_LAOST|nr:hypothetical protein LSTR_LSTR008147 [Laodelphax striatellus]